MKIGAISLILVLLLTGCNASSELERGMALRSSLLKAQECLLETEITAQYDDLSYTFSMDCSFDTLANMTFTVTKPETISGIRGSISHEGGRLRFDNTALYFGLLTDDQISPVAAPWILMKTLRSGYLTSACTEGEFTRLSIDDSFEDDALHLDIWLDSRNTPVRAEIVYDDLRILSLNVKTFVIR